MKIYFVFTNQAIIARLIVPSLIFKVNARNVSTLILTIPFYLKLRQSILKNVTNKKIQVEDFDLYFFKPRLRLKPCKLLLRHHREHRCKLRCRKQGLLRLPCKHPPSFSSIRRLPSRMSRTGRFFYP